MTGEDVVKIQSVLALAKCPNKNCNSGIVERFVGYDDKTSTKMLKGFPCEWCEARAESIVKLSKRKVAL